MIRRLLGGKPETRSISFQDIFKRGLDSTTNQTASGELVNTDTAMTLTSVYASIRLLSDTISTLEFSTYYKSRGAELPFRPVPEWLRAMSIDLANHEVLGQCLVSLLTDGNCYVATLRDATGQVLSLTVLDPGDITPKMVTHDDGTQELTFESAKTPGTVFTKRDIQMIRGMVRPGQISGVSPIQMAREMIGLGIAMQRFSATLYKNGALPGSVIEVPGQLSTEGAASMRQNWNDLHRGSGNAHRVAVLTEGSKFSKMSLSPEDVQWIEGTRATTQDVARLFGLPPFLLADSTGSTSWGSGLHEMNVAMVTYSLRPLTTRLEAGLTAILRSTGINVGYVKFDLASMTRGTNERWDSYATALQNGIVNIDEVRSWESLPPLPNDEGKSHYVPLNQGVVGAETAIDADGVT